MDTAIGPEHIRISHISDVAAVRNAVQRMARQVGHNGSAIDEIGLVSVELVTNILKYAKSGTIVLKIIDDEDRRGIQIESIDKGPGIRDFEEAVVDGYSTSGSLGYGLGAVHRMMDHLEIAANGHDTPGTHIIARRWVRTDTAETVQCPLDIGACTRSYPGMKLNGDAFVIKKWGHHALAGVIDGLGHGQYAHHASQKARQYVDSHYDMRLEDIFRGVQRACRATRGVVMALARFDWAEKQFHYASVGNIEVREINASLPVRFQIRRGIIGKNAPNTVVTIHPWEMNNILIIHSDGISTHWQWRDFIHLADKSATDLSYHLMRAQGKDNDDATIVVIKSR